MVIIEANGGYHLKGYSSVSFKTGEPLQKLKADGTPLRVQQSVLLARKNEQFPSKTHWRVQELAVAKQRQIEEWEKTLETVTNESGNGTSREGMTIANFYETIFIPWLEELVKTGQKAHSTLVAYKHYWTVYL